MKLLLTALFLFLAPVYSLFAQTGNARWYKGNTHAHSYWSDGNDFPEEVMAWYKSHGYQFVSLTDHNTLAQGELWKIVASKPPIRMVQQKWFDHYLQNYGEKWVVSKRDTAGLKVKLKTLAEYRHLFEEPGKFLLMPGEELSAEYGGEPIHMCLINISEEQKPLKGTSKADVLQKNLDQFYQKQQVAHQPMLVQINHPNFKNSLKFDDLKNLNGARFFEVFNGHPLVNNYGDSSAISTETLWDQLLLAFIKQGKPLLYAVGTEDSHEYHDFTIDKGTPGRAWIMVRANELTPAALVDAMQRGDFYASSGVVLKDVQTTQGQYVITVSPEKNTTYTIQFWGANKNDTEGRLLKEIKSAKGLYPLTKDLLYVRAKIISSKQKTNPFKEGDFETAWTQPVTSQ